MIKKEKNRRKGCIGTLFGTADIHSIQSTIRPRANQLGAYNILQVSDAHRYEVYLHCDSAIVRFTAEQPWPDTLMTDVDGGTVNS